MPRFYHFVLHHFAKEWGVDYLQNDEAQNDKNINRNPTSVMLEDARGFPLHFVPCLIYHKSERRSPTSPGTRMMKMNLDQHLYHQHFMARHPKNLRTNANFELLVARSSFWTGTKPGLLVLRRHLRPNENRSTDD